MTCCKGFLNLGCFGHCDPIDTGLIALQSGDFTICYNSVQGNLCQVLKFSVDEPIAFVSFSTLYGNHQVTITDPNGVFLGCFRFITSITYALTL